MPVLIQFASCLIMVGLCVLVIDNMPAQSGLFFSLDGIPIVDALLWISVPLFFGIIFGQAFRYVQTRRTSASLGSIWCAFRRSNHTMLSILISPIVFFTIFQGSSGDGSLLKTSQTLAFSFQNGFFINHLMATILARGRDEFGS